MNNQKITFNLNKDNWKEIISGSSDPPPPTQEQAKKKSQIDFRPGPQVKIFEATGRRVDARHVEFEPESDFDLDHIIGRFSSQKTPHATAINKRITELEQEKKESEKRGSQGKKSFLKPVVPREPKENEQPKKPNALDSRVRQERTPKSQLAFVPRTVTSNAPKKLVSNSKEPDSQIVKKPESMNIEKEKNKTPEERRIEKTKTVVQKSAQNLENPNLGKIMGSEPKNSETPAIQQKSKEPQGQKVVSQESQQSEDSYCEFMMSIQFPEGYKPDLVPKKSKKPKEQETKDPQTLLPDAQTFEEIYPRHFDELLDRVRSLEVVGEVAEYLLMRVGKKVVEKKDVKEVGTETVSWLADDPIALKKENEILKKQLKENKAGNLVNDLISKQLEENKEKKEKEGAGSHQEVERLRKELHQKNHQIGKLKKEKEEAEMKLAVGTIEWDEEKRNHRQEIASFEALVAEQKEMLKKNAVALQTLHTNPPPPVPMPNFLAPPPMFHAPQHHSAAFHPFSPPPVPPPTMMRSTTPAYLGTPRTPGYQETHPAAFNLFSPPPVPPPTLVRPVTPAYSGTPRTPRYQSPLPTAHSSSQKRSSTGYTSHSDQPPTRRSRFDRS